MLNEEILSCKLFVPFSPKKQYANIAAAHHAIAKYNFYDVQRNFDAILDIKQINI